jgi:hypothetical protein
MTNTLTIADIRSFTLKLLPPIFADCVADEDEHRKYSISAPFVWREWVAATEGHILVRQELTRVNRVIAPILALFTDRKTPDLTDVTTKATYSDAPVDLPPGLPGKTTCESCGGDGKSFCECCDRMMDCPACDGEGEAYSLDCRVWLSGQVPIGLRYAHLLKKHEASIYLPDLPPDKAVRFTIDGSVEGFLMPMTLEDPAKRTAGQGAK